MIGLAGIELCEHGKRYCASCGTVVPRDQYTPEQWSEASRLMRLWATKREKAEKKEQPE